MKSQTYMTRALQSRDPRYATILGRLGYAAPDREPAPAKELDVSALRVEYEEVFGKKPFMGWDAGTLAAKIAEKRAG